MLGQVILGFSGTGIALRGDRVTALTWTMTEMWCVVGGCYTLISVVLIHQCLLGLLVSAPSLLCEGRGFEPPLGRGKITWEGRWEGKWEGR